MKKNLLVVSLSALALTIGSVPVFAADQDRDRAMEQSRQQEVIYGWQLMTEKERAEHREKMQAMKTEEERERYRQEHHEKMQARAMEQGVTLPEVPLQRGQGMNQGGGMGMGGGGRR